MPLYRDEAIVLRTQKLGEADRIITLLGRNHGKIRAVARGVRRTSSKFGARLEPFMVVDGQFYEGRTLDTVTQVVALAGYGAQIAADYDAYTAAMAIVELADRIVDAEPSEQQYVLLLGATRTLARNEHRAEDVLYSYMLRALALGGWRASVDECARCGAPGPHSVFVAQMGGMVCDSCAPTGASPVPDEVRRLLVALMEGDWQTIGGAPESVRRHAGVLVAGYAQFTLERGIRSLRNVGHH